MHTLHPDKLASIQGILGRRKRRKAQAKPKATNNDQSLVAALASRVYDEAQNQRQSR